MKNILNKPIKAKTLKKKLENTLQQERVNELHNYRKNRDKFYDNKFVYKSKKKLEKIEVEKYLKSDKFIKDFLKPLQNNKPSIELIEKIEFGEYVLENKVVMNVAEKILANKINEIIEKLNEHSVRLGEDNN